MVATMVAVAMAVTPMAEKQKSAYYPPARHAARPARARHVHAPLANYSARPARAHHAPPPPLAHPTHDGAEDSGDGGDGGGDDAPC